MNVVDDKISLILSTSIISSLKLFVLWENEGSISENSDSRGEYVLVKTLSGKGSKSTDEFRINSSIVKIKAKTWGASVGSFSSFSLESDSGRRVRGGSMTISTKSSESGGESSTTIRNLSPGGYYYIKAISGIHWEVNVYEYR